MGAGTDTAIGLLVYGSLMHPEALAPKFGVAASSLPVRIRGYRRSFCQEPSWRKGAAERRGVLTVRPSGGSWVNAILVCGCGSEVFRTLDHRERGYTRVEVARGMIEPYGPGAEVDALDRISIYGGRREMWNPALLPNPGYLDLCIRAARGWGERFLEDFLATTRVGDVTLRSFRRSRGAASADPSPGSSGRYPKGPA